MRKIGYENCAGLLVSVESCIRRVEQKISLVNSTVMIYEKLCTSTQCSWELFSIKSKTIDQSIQGH